MKRLKWGGKEHNCESRTLSWEINKRKKKVKKKKKKRERWKWVDNMAADVVQQEHNNKKYYASTFRYIYI